MFKYTAPLQLILCKTALIHLVSYRVIQQKLKESAAWMQWYRFLEEAVRFDGWQRSSSFSAVFLLAPLNTLHVQLVGIAHTFALHRLSCKTLQLRTVFKMYPTLLESPVTAFAGPQEFHRIHGCDPQDANVPHEASDTHTKPSVNNFYSSKP